MTAAAVRPNGSIAGMLAARHVHQLIRLLAEAHAIPAAAGEREQHLASGLAGILGAAVASTVLDTTVALHGNSRYPAVLIGWNRTALQTPEVLREAGRSLISIVRVMMHSIPCEPGAALTMTWRELTMDRRWQGLERIEPYACPLGLAEPLFSCVRLKTPSHIQGLGLYREPDRARFSDEERNLVGVFHTACEGLLQPPPSDEDDDEPTRVRLSPRQRQTLALALNGLCDKEIAERLGISRHTVNQYTKAIYRHYAVTSRAQLLARLLA